MQAYQQQAQPVVDYYNKATTFLQKGDLESFFEFINIPDAKIFEYAVKKAEQSQLPPEQQQQYMNQRQVQRDREMLANQNQQIQTQQQQQLSEFRNQELNWVLQKPDVPSVSQAFTAKNGTGSFRTIVVDQGLNT